MKTKHLTTISILLLILFSFSCKKEVPNEIINESLKGDWMVTSWLVQGAEFMGGNSEFKITFLSEGGTSGTSIWKNQVGQYFMDAHLEIPFEIDNNSEQIDFSGDIFTIRMLNKEELILHGHWGESFWKIEAIKQ